MEFEEISEDEFIYALLRLPGIGSGTVIKLCEKGLSFRDILYMEENRLRDGLSLGSDRISSLMRLRKDFKKYRYEYSRLKDSGIDIIAYTGKDYPGSLKKLKDPPAALFIKGERGIPAGADPKIGMIGSRTADEKTKRSAYNTSLKLSDRGFTIVSGLATGIDEAAHTGAVDSDRGKTIAALGTAIDICYPAANKFLYDRISRGKGTVISEYGPGLTTGRYGFVRRDRIIAALSDLLIAFDVRENSGTFLTCRKTLELGKPVYIIKRNGKYNKTEAESCLENLGAVLYETEDEAYPSILNTCCT